MITANVIQRVFHLKFGHGTGTCFAIDFDGRQYLVTAKHVIASLIDNDPIEIYFNGNWEKIVVRLIGHHPTADISVFCLDILLANLKLEPSSNGIIYGQDTFFLGFPYRLMDENSSQINRNFPIPLVKKATLSCITKDNTGSYLLLDGINNPGFSGGPVVFTEPNQRDFKVAAVISGYRFSEEPTYHQNQETQISVRANTGIIIAYSIENAVDLIKQNPIGKEIQ
jgi:S1-C subfamily serine protease